MDSLSPRERVATVLAHEDPGKVPIDLGEGRQTSIYREPYLTALAVLGIGESEIITSPRGVIDQFDERSLRSLDIDFRRVSLRDVPEGQVFESGDILRDEWYARFNREPDRKDIGFGHSSDDVAAFKSPGLEILLSYHQAVLERWSQYIRSSRRLTSSAS